MTDSLVVERHGWLGQLAEFLLVPLGVLRFLFPAPVPGRDVPLEPLPRVEWPEPPRRPVAPPNQVVVD